MSAGFEDIPDWAVLPPETTAEDLYQALGSRPDPEGWYVPVSIGSDESASEYAVRRTVERRLAAGRLL